MDVLEYWRLRERPFEATWDARFFFQSKDHDEALNRLGILVGEETMLFGMLTGEVGCGKTLTRAVFTERLEEQRFKVVAQENPRFTSNRSTSATRWIIFVAASRQRGIRRASCSQLMRLNVRSRPRAALVMISTNEQLKRVSLLQKALSSLDEGGCAYHIATSC